MAKKASLAKSGSISSLCVMYGAGIAFAITLAVSNGLGAATAGQFFNLMGLFAIGTSLSVFGADTGLVRTISAQNALGRYSAIPRLIRYAMTPVFGLAIFMTIAAFIYSAVVPMLPGYAMAIRMSAIFLIVAAVMTVYFGVLRGLNQVVTFTMLQNVMLPTLRLGAVVMVVFASGSLLDLVFAWTLPVAATAALTLWIVECSIPTDKDEPVPAAAETPEETARSFWGFSSARGIATIVETTLEWIDVIAISLFLSPAAGGIYGAVNRCVRVGVMVEHTGRIVTGPSISAALATKNIKRAREIFLATTRVLTAAAWPFYLTLAFFGPTLLGFFGKGFERGAGILWVICPAAMIAMSAGGVQSILLMSGKSRWQLVNKLSSLVVCTTLLFTLVPVWGLYGAVTAWASALLIDTFLASYQVFRLVGIRTSISEMAPALILGAAAPTVWALLIIAIFNQGALSLLIYLILLAPSYLFLLYYFRGALGLDKFLSARRKGAKASQEAKKPATPAAAEPAADRARQEPVVEPARPATQKPTQSSPSFVYQLATQGEITMTADATTEQPPAASLGEQLHRIWRHKSVVLITTVVCAIIALLFTLFSVPKYSAEARLTINSLVSQANVGQKSAKPEKVDTNTEAQRAASKEVADRAADLLASEGADSGMDSKKLSKKLLASTKISAISQTSVLKIEVTDTDSKLAAQYANAISRAYLEFRETPLKQTINERVKQIDDQVAQLQGEDTKTNANKIADLQERRNQMTGLQTSGGEITKPAQTPTKVNGLTRPQTVLAGGAIGLLLGIFFAYAYDRSMRHIGYPDRLKDLGIMVQPLRPTSFDEDTLILMRRFGAPDGNLKKSKIPGVVIASESPALADQLHRQLYHILPDGVAHFTDYKALSKLLDNYTPEQIVESNDIPMVINLEDEAPLSTLLRLAEACQVCLVPVGETSSRSHMRKLFKHLQELDNTISIAVFMVSPKKNKVISNAPVKTA